MSEDEIATKFPNRPQNHSETLKFHELYLTLFDPLAENKKKKTGIGLRGRKDLKPHEVRRQIIDNFIARWRNEVGNDIFPAFRLILCDKDRDRNVYNLKEQKIGKLLVKVMKIDRKSEDGSALIHWKNPRSWQKNAGDFALRCYDIIKKRPMRTTPGDLTISQVNAMLDRLAQGSGEEQQLPIMEQFYNEMCAEELTWLIRIILRAMKVGATEKTFFDAWHPDADALYNVSSSLRRVCWDLWDPNFRLQDDTKGITLMSCFQPQLAQFQKKNMEDTVKAMGGTEFWIEEKLDGERMQMHFDGRNFEWWSRKAKEYTHLYGETQTEGAIARFTGSAFNRNVKSIILDGEMITWDPVMDTIVGFGTLKTAAIETNNNPHGQGHRPLFRVFDILYLNGKCLVDYSLSDRRKALERAVKDVPRRLEIHPYTPANTAREIESELRKVIASASEGLVIKKPESAYRLNDRNDSWIKVKPEYMTEFGESLDLLVIGGYWGQGSRGNILASYLCGLRLDGNYLKPGDPKVKYWSFCKVGGGFTANDYKLIEHNTHGHWKDWAPGKGPDFIELAGGPREYERPNVWIPPEKSFVIEVKAAQVSNSDQFRTGFTLRFPRLKNIRSDKSWDSALTISDFLRLKNEAVEAEEEKKLELEIRKGRAKRIKKELKVAGGDAVPEFVGEPTPTQVDDVKPLFEGHSFFVMSDSISPKTPKAEIEALIKANGGKIYQNIREDPKAHLIGDRNTVKIAAVKKANQRDIIRPHWVFDCLQHRYILPLEPDRYVLHALPETAEEIQHNIDEFADSYARNVEVDELKQILDGMTVSDEKSSLSQEVMHSEEIKEMGELPGLIFRDSMVYFPTDMCLPKIMVEFAGGKVSETLEEDTLTHIVVHGVEDAERARKKVAECKIPRVVSEMWVRESVKAKTLLDEDRFVI
ncbi:ATP-dependent DNA ligase [Ascodesmis nigricans]|uniref:DNA ligase n=1 Tax=Ascodesmis nigricans TaxID=341454 RepID=A0A4S2MJX9_9PEZI|nr:ATP-dependent DNA ligase [Ascodesmis nigricans]